MGTVVEMKATTQTQVENKTESLKVENKSLKPMYDLVMKNLNATGNKQHAYVPIESLEIDLRYQRDPQLAKGKIKHLVDNWNPYKMDSLRIVPHPETYTFSVVDGGHRLEALKIMGASGVECEVLLGLSDDPDERLKEEAFIFSTQNKQKNILYPTQTHNANLICGVKANIIVDNLCKKYHIPLKKNLRGRTKSTHLAGFDRALKIANSHGEEMLDNIFNVICSSRWNLSSKGLGNLVLTTIKHILSLHPEHTEVIVNALIEYFTPIDPSQFFANAYTKYPERKEQERLVLFLEDYLVETLGLTRVYSGGSVTTAAKENAA